MNEVRARARALGVKTSRRKKSDVIREIQTAEGNFPCFGTAGRYCDQTGCVWRSLCIEPA